MANENMKGSTVNSEVVAGDKTRRKILSMEGVKKKKILIGAAIAALAATVAGFLIVRKNGSESEVDD